MLNNLLAWIASFEEGDETLLTSKPTDHLLSPAPAHSAQHHFAPSSPSRRVSQDGYIDTYDDDLDKKHETGFFGVHREPVKGRKWDHAREEEPVIMKPQGSSGSSSWNSYIRSSMYGPAVAEDGERVDESFLEQQTPGYVRPWRGDLEKGREDSEKLTQLLHSKKMRRTFVQRWQVYYVPMHIFASKCLSFHTNDSHRITFSCTPSSL